MKNEISDADIITQADLHNALSFHYDPAKAVSFARGVLGLIKPNMFWNNDDPERCGDSIHEILDREWSNGTLEIGATLAIQQAMHMENCMVRVIKGEDEDSFDYEVITREEYLKELDKPLSNV